MDPFSGTLRSRLGRTTVATALLGIGTVMLTGSAAAQEVQQTEYTGPDTMTVALFAAGAAFLGALVANLAWKAMTDDGNSGTATPGRAHQPSEAQAPPAGGNQQYETAGTDAGGRQGRDNPGPGGANDRSGGNRGR